MGTEIKDWAEATAGMYMGYNTSWEVIWVCVAAALCVIALVVGSKHELDAYRKVPESKSSED